MGLSWLAVLPIKTGRHALKFRAARLKPPRDAARLGTSTHALA
jgi:hypothetical protein